MPPDRTAAHRRAMLTRDAESVDQCATRLAGLITHIRHAARDCADHATAARLTEWAQGLADVTHNDLAAVIVAHEAACEGEGAASMFALDLALAVCFGMASPELQRVPIELADVEHLRAAE